MTRHVPIPPGPIRFACGILAGILAVGHPAAGQPRQTPDTRAKLDTLLSDLGDPDYFKREAASRDLLALGTAARPAVARTLRTNPNPEVQGRCRTLLARIAYANCLDRSRKVLGDSPEAAALFRELYLAEKPLWVAFADDAPDLPALYVARCDDLANGPPRSPAGRGFAPPPFDRFRYQVSEETLATLLLVGAACRDRLPREGLETATKLFTRTWGRRYAKNTPPLLRTAYVAWAEQVGGLPVEYSGDKKQEAARRTLRSPDTPASERPYALLTVALANDPADEAAIRALLTDDTLCDILFVKGAKVRVELRDVALAATLYRAAKDPRDFGFDRLKPDPTYLYTPSSLGFSTAAARAAAFQKWKDAEKKK